MLIYITTIFATSSLCCRRSAASTVLFWCTRKQGYGKLGTMMITVINDTTWRRVVTIFGELIDPSRAFRLGVLAEALEHQAGNAPNADLGIARRKLHPPGL